MKKLIYLLLIAPFAITSCSKKNLTDPIPAANLLVSNNVIGGSSITLTPSAIAIFSNDFGSFPLQAGNNMVKIVNFKTPQSTYFNQNLTITEGGNYSLFLSGSSITQIQPVLINENYKNYTDSLCGVRFINLSPNSNPISVNITGQPNGSEVANLAYKAYTPFKQYAAKKINSTYSFQIRDTSSGNLIASYTLNTPYFHNATIVLTGLVGGIPGNSASLVLHP